MRDFAHHNRHDFEHIYGIDYLDNASSRAAAELIESMSLAPDSTVLELGSGPGHLTLPLASKLDALDGTGSLLAYEPSERTAEALARAARESKVDHRVKLWTLSAPPDPSFLPIKRASIDVVVSMNAAHTMTDPLLLYCELSRVLKPGGRLFLAEGAHPYAPTSLPTIDFAASSAEDVISDLTVAGLWPCEKLSIAGFSWVVKATKSARSPKELKA